MEHNKAPFTLIAIFSALALAGFYLMFSQIADLRTEVSNLKLTLELKNRPAQTAPETPVPAQPAPAPQPAATGTPAAAENPGATVPSAIVFETMSSDALLPQAKTTVMVDAAAKSPDGTLSFAVKVYTNNAKTHTAIDLKKSLSLFNGDTDNTPPETVDGNFDSMPPASSITGRVTFKIAPETNSAILQVGDGDNAAFYQFNFTNKTYKRVDVG